jgi:hypothetical protein
VSSLIIFQEGVIFIPGVCCIICKIFLHIAEKKRVMWREGQVRGVTKRCRLFWLTNSALVYEPKCGGRGGGGRGGLTLGLRGLSQ